jgi:hypothetical protein
LSISGVTQGTSETEQNAVQAEAAEPATAIGANRAAEDSDGMQESIRSTTMQIIPRAHPDNTAIESSGMFISKNTQLIDLLTDCQIADFPTTNNDLSCDSLERASNVSNAIIIF